MSKVIAFGEIMLRLAPEGYQRFVQAESFGAVYGGSEANVALSLSLLGSVAAYVTKLPAHELGQAAVNSLRRYGVDTSMVVRGGPRIGVYFLEKGASQRASKVVYDRAGSSIALAEPSDFDWDAIFADADWFHLTGITPALGGHLPEICLEACRAAKDRGLTVSFDPNYRKNLWTLERANEVISGLMPYVDLLISNETQARELFGLNCAETEDRIGNSRAVAEALYRRFPLKKIALTIRTTIHAEENLFQAMLFSREAEAISQQHDLHIIDRVGGGDAFAAGLIHALRSGWTDDRSIRFAAAAAALKHSVEGDANLMNEQEVSALAEGGSNARVSR